MVCNMLHVSLYFCYSSVWLAYVDALQALCLGWPLTCLHPSNVLLAAGLGEGNGVIGNVALKSWSRFCPPTLQMTCDGSFDIGCHWSQRLNVRSTTARGPRGGTIARLPGHIAHRCYIIQQ